MPFAAALQQSLQARDSVVAAEFTRGDSLEEVLNRHLMTVEKMGGDDVFTCILLLSADGKRLSYGAAPTVPASYCRASESIEIGPYAGSCGAAAYWGRPVYSIDIEADPPVSRPPDCHGRASGEGPQPVVHRGSRKIAGREMT